MIKQIQLVHYLSETTFKNLCKQLDSPAAKHYPYSHTFYYIDSPVSELQFFEVDLKQPIHIFIMESVIDFPGFGCDYTGFPAALYKKYNELFGGEIMRDFPEYNDICCDYIEYTDIIEVKNSDKTLERLLSDRCVPEQLDRARWSEFKKPQSTIKFCIAKKDDTHIETLACAHGMALKSRIKDKEFHKFNGILPSRIINLAAEKEIMAWLMHMYNVIDKAEVIYTPVDMVSVLSGDNLKIANEFIALAENMKLKAAVRYAAGHKTWKCVYTSPKPKRTVFTIESAAEKLNIKACLFNIDRYLAGFPDISEKIIYQLKNNAWNCSRCNPNCRGGAALTIDGITESKCIGGAFNFNNLSIVEWHSIIELIKKEVNNAEEI
jgi:hypothetical protein